jgi:hypothetical protein
MFAYDKSHNGRISDRDLNHCRGDGDGFTNEV